MRTFTSFIVVAGVMLLASQADAGTLFGDQFADMSNVSVGIWDEGGWTGEPTWSTGASPGGKAGTSLHANFTGTAPSGPGGPNYLSHRTIGFGGVVPATGQATFLSRFYISGPSQADAFVTGSIRQAGVGSNNFQLDRAAGSPGILNARTYHPYKVIATPAYSQDTWYSVAWVVDDLSSGSSDAHLYMAAGMSVGLGDYVASASASGSGVDGTSITTWDFGPYVKTVDYQAWDFYYDDVTVNSGQDFTFIPEPGMPLLALFGLLSLGMLAWKKRRNV